MEILDRVLGGWFFAIFQKAGENQGLNPNVDLYSSVELVVSIL